MMRQRLTDNFDGFSTESVTQVRASRTKGKPGASLEGVLPDRDVMAAERLEAAGRLAAWVAHQINNPLGAMSGNAQLLARRLQRDIQDTHVLGEYLRYIDGIQSQAERCARITGEMLNFTRPGEPNFRPTDIYALVDEVISLVKYRYPECIVIAENPVEKLPSISADREWLSRALFELLSNAVEASDHTPVSIVLAENTDDVKILVKDMGKGISEDAISRVFDPFFSTREKARGLGLTIALEMIRKMGGTLRVVETGSEGTTFAVTLAVWGRHR